LLLLTHDKPQHQRLVREGEVRTGPPRDEMGEEEEGAHDPGEGLDQRGHARGVGHEEVAGEGDTCGVVGVGGGCHGGWYCLGSSLLPLSIEYKHMKLSAVP
jgi:hypothetical protein